MPKCSNDEKSILGFNSPVRDNFITEDDDDDDCKKIFFLLHVCAL